MTSYFFKLTPALDSENNLVLPFSKKNTKVGLIAHTCNPSACDVEAGGSGVQVRLGYIVS